MLHIDAAADAFGHERAFAQQLLLTGSRQGWCYR